MQNSPETFDPGYEAQGRGGNTLGVVGFALAFCVSPLGLLLSLIALRKQPRGFAIAGSVIGLVGTVVWAIVGAGAVFSAPYIAKGVDLSQDYLAISQAVESYKTKNNGALPADLAAAGVTGDEATDPFNQPYRFAPSADGKGWSLEISGPDNAFGTSDDQSLAGGLDQSQLGSSIGQFMQNYYRAAYENKPAPSTVPSTPATAPSEAKPAEPKPAESKPEETKPADAPAESKPASPQ